MLTEMLRKAYEEVTIRSVKEPPALIGSQYKV